MCPCSFCICVFCRAVLTTPRRGGAAAGRLGPCWLLVGVPGGGVAKPLLLLAYRLLA